MLERDMEDLLWMYPDKLLEPLLKQFRRQPRSAVGRADLVFEDKLGRLLVIEIKRGKLQRGAIGQVLDYFGMMKNQFKDKSVEMMVIAESIPSERKLTLHNYDIEYLEISDKRFRDVALEMGYVFQSEHGSTPCISGPTDIVTLESDKPVTTPPPSKGPRAELMAVVNAYDLTVEPDLRVRDGSAQHYRQIYPPEWKTSHLHYEFYQACDRIGAELHLAKELAPREVDSIAKFLRERFDGKPVANGEGKVTWHQERNGGRGCLAAVFPLKSSPGTVAAAMRDLIDMTRPGVSEYLKTHVPAALRAQFTKGGARAPESPRQQMAGSLGRGEPVKVCAAVLDCLAVTSSWTNMETLKVLMRDRRKALGEPYAGKSYYDGWGALADVGMTERRSDEGPHEQRITEKGKAYLEQHRWLLDKGPST